MPVQFDKFDQSKVDNLKNHLVSMEKKGTPKFYEIFVDNLKAVQKTDDPEEFDNYENYLSPDTASIKIAVYNSGVSPRNDKFVFYFKAVDRDDAVEIGLSGTPIKTYSYKDITEWRKTNEKKSAEQLEIKLLKGTIGEQSRKLKENADEIESFKEAIWELKTKGNKLGGIHLGNILSVAADDWLQRHPKLVAQIPYVGETLAGVIEEDKKQKTIQLEPPLTEASFSKKDPNQATTDLSEQDKNLLGLIKEVQQRFNQVEFEQVIEILDILASDKSQIKPVLDLIQGEEQGNDEP